MHKTMHEYVCMCILNALSYFIGTYIYMLLDEFVHIRHYVVTCVHLCKYRLALKNVKKIVALEKRLSSWQTGPFMIEVCVCSYVYMFVCI